MTQFVQNGLGSVWALNVMLVLRENPERRWNAVELVAHLRASETVVRDVLSRLNALGKLIVFEGGGWRWRPASAELSDLCRRIAEEYAQRPVGLVNLIARRPLSPEPDRE